MVDNIILILFLSTLGISFAAVILRHWDWMPVMLLPILWYIPRQTASGGLLQNYLILRWTTIFIVPLIIFIQFVKVTGKSQSLKLSNIALPLGIFIVFSVCSAILNNVALLELLGSLILYIRYPLLFIAFINMDIPRNVVKIFSRLFLFLVIIQVPECIYRYAALGITMDHISWTMGPWGHFDLGIYMVYAVALITAFGLVKGFNWLHIAVFAFLFILALLGEIKAFILSAPVVSVFTIYAVLRQKQRPNEKQVSKRLLAVLFPVFFLVFSYCTFAVWGKIHYGRSNTLIPFLQNLPVILRHPLSFLQGDEIAYSAARISGGAVVWSYLKKDWGMLMFGLGPGSALAGNFLARPGSLFNISAPALNQLGAILAEVGIIGWSLYFWMLLRLLHTIVRANISIEDTNLRILSASLVGMWFFYAVLGPFYDLVWRHDASSYIFYFFAAVVYNHLQNKSRLLAVQNKSG